MDENEDEDLNYFREILEQEFLKAIQNGDDIAYFLYFPPNTLSESIKTVLDEFLIKKAYDYITAESFDLSRFIVYSDNFVTVEIETYEQRIELLDKLLTYYTDKEDYEKCVIVQNIKNKIQL